MNKAWPYIIKLFLWAIIYIFSAEADILVEHISAEKCKQGLHSQPNGVFGVYVFCDDALGSNIAVLFDKLHGPFEGDYQLNNRFWQNQKWQTDVNSFAWLKEDFLLVATDAIYGTGSVYLVDMRKQEAKELPILDSDICLNEISSVTGQEVKIKVAFCDQKVKVFTLNITK